MSSTDPLKIGRYEIKGELGRGGMAVVYRAFDPQVSREVAVKILPPQYLADSEFRTRFGREARTIAALEHPAIVPLYDFGEDRGQLFYVMRLMPGGSLSERLRRGALSFAETIRLLNRIAPALDEAHARGIIHRDLKPGNILFDGRGEPYISDFGIAKQLGGSGNTTGGVMGTPAYMSPEQARGEREITHRSDLYALGAILFECLTGRHPYEAETPIGVVLRHLHDPVPRIVQVNPALPLGCNELMNCAMAKAPAERFATAGDMVQALESVRRGEPITVWRRNFDRAPTLPSAPVETARLPSSSAPTWRGRQPLPRAVSFTLALLGGGALALIVFLAVIGIGLYVVGPLSATATPDPTAAALAAREAAAHTAQAQATASQQAVLRASLDAQSTRESHAAATTTAVAMAQGSTATVAARATAGALGTAGAQGTSTAVAVGATVQADATNIALLSQARVAFFKNDDVWIVNPDGGNLTQLTFDGGQKKNLRWLPGGESLAYISGRCIQTVHFLSGSAGTLGCFNSSELLEGFEISPDGRYFAYSIDRITYVGDYNPDLLVPITNIGQLRTLAGCMIFSRSATKLLRWSADTQAIAIMVIGVADTGGASDTIQLLRLRCGDNQPPNLDQFPGTRFSLPRFSQLRTLQNFGWDGRELFALIDHVRNEGFGNLYVYNTGTKRQPVQLNPLGGCCYRDPMWSADGANFVFLFQDQGQGSANPIDLYYADYNRVLSGARLTPIPLPAGFFDNPREKPEPALSP